MCCVHRKSQQFLCRVVRCNIYESKEGGSKPVPRWSQDASSFIIRNNTFQCCMTIILQGTILTPYLMLLFYLQYGDLSEKEPRGKDDYTWIASAGKVVQHWILKIEDQSLDVDDKKFPSFVVPPEKYCDHSYFWICIYRVRVITVNGP